MDYLRPATQLVSSFVGYFVSFLRLKKSENEVQHIIDVVTSDILNNLPDDLLEKEIFPWLSYTHLAKIARVSKKFSAITKRVGPYSIDLFQ